VIRKVLLCDKEGSSVIRECSVLRKGQYCCKKDRISQEGNAFW